MEKRFSRGFGMGILVAVGTLLGGCATEMQEDVESDEDAVLKFEHVLRSFGLVAKADIQAQEHGQETP